MKLSIIIPVYNEKDFIEKLINLVKEIPVDKEIIVIDDCSKDGTGDVIKKIKGIKAISHDVNKGKGSAIRTGLQYADGEYIIIQDADLEYSPYDIPRLFHYAIKYNLDAVYGSRFKGKGKFLPHSYFANRVLTMLTDILFGGNISDMETCYKLVRTDILKSLNLKSRRFDIEPEITSKLLRKGIKIWELPINYKARTEKEGKKIHWKDAVVAIMVLCKIWIM